ncbi:MAG: alpha/beta hydrolase [Bowdeniella nasicola]|nr:alpha/beta hydrolase [Bowdeniella nasicola]
MMIDEWGTQHARRLLFLPGAFSDPRWYTPTLETLARQWHTVAVTYDGYHEPFESSFTSVEQTAASVTAALVERGIEEVDVVYGLSLGGAVAHLIHACDRLRIGTLVLDAAIAPYRLPRWLTRLILLRDLAGFALLRRSTTVMKLAFPPERWLYPWEDEDSYGESAAFLARLTGETVRRCFDSVNNYAVPGVLPRRETRLHYIYGDREARARASDIAYFREAYPEITVTAIPDRDHGELATIGYREFAGVLEGLAR